MSVDVKIAPVFPSYVEKQDGNLLGIPDVEFTIPDFRLIHPLIKKAWRSMMTNWNVNELHRISYHNVQFKSDFLAELVVDGIMGLQLEMETALESPLYDTEDYFYMSHRLFQSCSQKGDVLIFDFDSYQIKNAVELARVGTKQSQYTSPEFFIKIYQAYAGVLRR